MLSATLHHEQQSSCYQEHTAAPLAELMNTMATWPQSITTTTGPPLSAWMGGQKLCLVEMYRKLAFTSHMLSLAVEFCPVLHMKTLKK